MVIDTHAHIIVPEITREASPEEEWRPHVYWEEDKQIVEYAGRQILTFALTVYTHHLFGGNNFHSLTLITAVF